MQTRLTPEAVEHLFISEAQGMSGFERLTLKRNLREISLYNFESVKEK
jgi:hypothetical protein